MSETVPTSAPSHCPELNSRSLRRPPVVEPMVPPPCSPSIIVRRCRRRPRRRRPAWTPSLSAALVCLSRRHRARQHVTPVCRERARMREKWRAGCVARTAETTSTTLAAAAPAALVAWPNRLTCPCQAQNAKNSSEKGRARSTRGADGRQTLPAPQLIVAALAHAPDRSHRQPGAAWHCHTVDFLKKARSW